MDDKERIAQLEQQVAKLEEAMRTLVASLDDHSSWYRRDFGDDEWYGHEEIAHLKSLYGDN